MVDGLVVDVLVLGGEVMVGGLSLATARCQGGAPSSVCFLSAPAPPPPARSVSPSSPSRQQMWLSVFALHRPSLGGD